MKSLLALAGSSHQDSINRRLALWVARTIPEVTYRGIDLNDFEMPLYSQDREEADGIPVLAKRFYQTVQASDGVVLSLAEHNGSYTAAFKNLLDWTSRHEQKLWAHKPMLLLSTSPGGRGGATVLAAAEDYFPRLGAEVAASFALPSFGDHFTDELGVTDPALKARLEEAVQRFLKALKST